MGSRLRLSVTLEGIIPIKIPCLDIGGTNLGSWCRHDLSLSPYLFSEYDVDELLGMVAVTGICEDYIPEGQACNLPLGPGSSHDLFCPSISLSNFGRNFILMKRSLREWRTSGDHLQRCSGYPRSFPQGFYSSLLSFH